MRMTAKDVVDLFVQREAFLCDCDEYLAAREYAFCVDAWETTGALTVPKSLQHYNTQIIETFNASWHDPDAMAGSILPYLENLCEYWENVHQAHQAALAKFSAAAEDGEGYCLYLRSFAHVFLTDVDSPLGRAVAYVNTEALDRNVAHALASAEGLNALTCLHMDDMALLEGKWILPAFRVHNHDWQSALVGAIEASKVIVFYLGRQSDGAEFELEAIRDAGLEHRTVIVYEQKANLPADADTFGGAIALSDFVTAGKDPLKTRLTARAKKQLTALMRDDHEPPAPLASLCELPCNVVDPDVPIDLPATIDPSKTFFVTPGNLTAFAWLTVGLPDAMLCWNGINRKLFHEKRAPEIAEVNELLQNVTMACLGAAALGLTSCLSAAIGLRVITANLVQVPQPERRAKRKAALLAALDIADRFDDLTVAHRWRKQNNGWREIVRDDHFS